MIEVSFFPGCTAHSTGIEYSMSMHAVVEALGLTFKEIEDWNCCGAAAAHSLNNLMGLALPARNIAKAQERELPLAVPCAGCFNAIKRAQFALTNDKDMREKLEDIVGFTYKDNLEVKLLHDIIQEKIGFDNLKKYIKKPLTDLNVVSYYGCAMVREPAVVQMGDYENPLFLDDIVEILGGNALDWSYKTDCCGADLGLSHGKIAKEISNKIADMAVEANADCIMVSCGLCQINLDMRQSGMGRKKIPVFYFTELMGIAMDLPDRNKWWVRHIVNPKPLLKSMNLLKTG